MPQHNFRETTEQQIITYCHLLLLQYEHLNLGGNNNTNTLLKILTQSMLDVDIIVCHCNEKPKLANYVETNNLLQ